jgi:hypothetical protein
MRPEDGDYFIEVKLRVLKVPEIAAFNQGLIPHKIMIGNSVSTMLCGSVDCPRGTYERRLPVQRTVHHQPAKGNARSPGGRETGQN